MMLDRLLPSFEDIKRVFSTLLRSSFIGTFIGCGPVPAAILLPLYLMIRRNAGLSIARTSAMVSPRAL